MVQQDGPVVFLDIDGVLNTPNTWGKHGTAAINAPLVARVQYLCEITHASIVISSTWRRAYSLSDIRGMLMERGLDASIIGITPINKTRVHKNRQDEILEWLDLADHRGPYVVLDDDTAGDGAWEKLAGHFIWIDPDTGVTDKNIEEAIDILKRGYTHVAV